MARERFTEKQALFVIALAIYKNSLASRQAHRNYFTGNIDRK
jgi:hypothetical protein